MIQEGNEQELCGLVFEELFMVPTWCRRCPLVVIDIIEYIIDI